MKKTTNTLFYTAIVLASFAPGLAFADTRTLKDLIKLAIQYMGYAIPVILTLAILSFIWGIYKRFFKADADVKEAGSFVLYGVIGFFVILSFWGLVNILINTFQLDTPNIQVPYVGGSGANFNANSNLGNNI